MSTNYYIWWQKIGTTMPPKAVPRAYCDGENFELYLNHFNRIAHANEWGEEAKLAYLETKLSGKAQREFEVFIEEDPKISFDDITEKLVEELEQSPQRALEAFTGMRLDDRSPKEFYGALVRQSKLAHGVMDDHARHIIVRTQMLQVLPHRLRKDAAMQGYLADMPKDVFLKLLTQVYDAEMRDEVDKTSYEPVVSHVQGATVHERLEKLEKANEHREKEMSEMMGMIREMYKGTQEDQGSKSRNGMRRSPGSVQKPRYGVCFKCLEEGHFARECPNKVKCARCHEEGHVKASCPKN